jgi:hypothetical protein
MFCRFGSVDDSRPVEATACWKVVCSRPVRGSSSSGQRLDVGRAQLGVQPPVEQHRDHRVRRAQLLEHAGVGRVAGLRPPAAGQVQLVEQDLLELLGRAEVELVADRRVDLLLQPTDLARELLRQLAEGARSMATPVASMSASTGISGSSSSSRMRRTAGRSPRSGRATRARRRRPGPAPRRAPDRAARPAWAARAQPLGADVGQALAAQRGVEDVGRDLGVEVVARQLGGGRVGGAVLGGRVAPGQLPDEQLLDLVADQRPAGGQDGRASCGRRVGVAATTRPSLPATARPSSVPRRGRGSSSARPTVSSGCAASQAVSSSSGMASLARIGRGHAAPGRAARPPGGPRHPRRGAPRLDRRRPQPRNGAAGRSRGSAAARCHHRRRAGAPPARGRARPPPAPAPADRPGAAARPGPLLLALDAGMRSTSVRNSYWRKRRSTSSRS